MDHTNAEIWAIKLAVLVFIVIWIHSTGDKR